MSNQLQGAGPRRAAPPFVWVLNPDAELELSSVGRYQARAHVLRQMEARVDQFSSLLGAEPSYFAHQLQASAANAAHRGYHALFWSATPRAQSAARQAGLRVGNAPSSDVLRRVSHKHFLSSTRCRTIPGRCFVSDERAFLAALQQGLFAWLSQTSHFRLKRPFGFAGRGQRRVHAELSPDDRRWIRDSLNRGGLLLEPELPGASAFSIHGYVPPNVAVPYLGRPCAFQSDAGGAPLRIPQQRVCTDLEWKMLSPAIEVEAACAATSLWHEGYFGPFGLDLLYFQEQLFSIDLNARFTLAWSLGMGAQRDPVISEHIRYCHKASGPAF